MEEREGVYSSNKSKKRERRASPLERRFSFHLYQRDGINSKGQFGSYWGKKDKGRKPQRGEGEFLIITPKEGSPKKKFSLFIL